MFRSINAAISSIGRNITRIDESARRISTAGVAARNAVTPAGSQRSRPSAPVNIAGEIVSIMAAETAVKADLAVIRSQDEMTGKLIDTMA